MIQFQLNISKNQDGQKIVGMDVAAPFQLVGLFFSSAVSIPRSQFTKELKLARDKDTYEGGINTFSVEFIDNSVIIEDDWDETTVTILKSEFYRLLDDWLIFLISEGL